MPALIHGEPVRLNDRVRRIVAPNPSRMTGAGTNSYLLGEERVAVVDPGPNIASHVDAILNAVGDRLGWILVTHTHPDHSPAAMPLHEATGAPMLGNPISDDGYQDTSFRSDHRFENDERMATDEFSLRAVHTPGHVDNHVCYFIEEEGMLLTGDHLMQGSTVVIIPPHGNMRAYIESLQRIREYPLRSLGPGHGDVMEAPIEVIDWTIAHRLERERKVLAALRAQAPVDRKGLVKTVYDDVDPALLGMAEMSLWAHLIKLAEDGLAIERADGEWQLVVDGPSVAATETP